MMRLGVSPSPLSQGQNPPQKSFVGQSPSETEAKQEREAAILTEISRWSATNLAEDRSRATPEGFLRWVL